jgi:uncharacterized membrane protein YphA (DoxX/SURF4 family)
MKIKPIVFWVTTGLLVLDLLAGGATSLLHPGALLSHLEHLGYPAYFASILGFWKLLGGVALLVPGMPVLKEWAYAGICFDLTSAAVSHAASGDGAPEVSAPLVIAVLAIASYVLRPQSRSDTVFDSERESSHSEAAL